MAKKYEAPEVKLLSFELEEAITDEGGGVGDIEGSEGIDIG